MFVDSGVYLGALFSATYEGLPLLLCICDPVPCGKKTSIFSVFEWSDFHRDLDAFFCASVHHRCCPGVACSVLPLNRCDLPSGTYRVVRHRAPSYQPPVSTRLVGHLRRFEIASIVPQPCSVGGSLLFAWFAVARSPLASDGYWTPRPLWREGQHYDYRFGV